MMRAIVTTAHSYTQKHHFLIYVQFPFKQTKRDRSWAFLSIWMTRLSKLAGPSIRGEILVCGVKSQDGALFKHRLPGTPTMPQLSELQTSEDYQFKSAFGSRHCIWFFCDLCHSNYSLCSYSLLIDHQFFWVILKVVINVTPNKCKNCDNQTFQKDGICVSCRIGINQLYTQLTDLLQKDTKCNLQTAKMAHRR